MKQILLLAAIAALWTSCSENDICIPTQGTNEIRISPFITEISPEDASRTLITAGTASWINGDAIGLFCSQISAANIQFTATGAGAAAVWSTTTPIYWLDGTTSHNFTAYYPYSSGNTDAALIKVPAINAQTTTISSTMDVLISNNLATSGVTRSGGAVGLVFTHAFALLEFDIQLGSGVLPASTLTSYTVAGSASEKLYTTDANSTVALASGAFTIGTGTNTMTITPTVPPVLLATPTAFYTMIVPATYTGPTLTVAFKDGGVTPYTTSATSLVTTKFDAGKKYTYTVTLGRSAISISNPTITDWTSVPSGSLNPGF